MHNYPPKLSSFLTDYDLKVVNLSRMSGQSPETLRHWYNCGKPTYKTQMIACIIAAQVWRNHTLVPICSDKPFSVGDPNDRNRFNKYLTTKRVDLLDMIAISSQSPETMRNWYNSENKYLLIDIIIDAIM